MTKQDRMLPYCPLVEDQDKRVAEAQEMRVNSLLAHECDYTGVSYTAQGIQVDRQSVREFGHSVIQC